MINSKNFLAIQGWMRTELDLKGNELMTFAVIYGFSQTDDQEFTGSRRYIAEWIGASSGTVDNCLKKLIDKKLVIKRQKLVQGVKFCSYSTPPEVRGVAQKLGGGSPKIVTNNIEENIELETKVSSRNDSTSAQKAEQKEFGNSDINEVVGYWNEATGLPIVARAQRSRRAAWSMLRNKAIGKDKLLHAIDIVASFQGDGYAPSVHDLFELQQKYNDVIGYERRQQAKAAEKKQPPQRGYSATYSGPVEYERRPYDGMPEFHEVSETVDPNWLEELKRKTFGSQK